MQGRAMWVVAVMAIGVSCVSVGEAKAACAMAYETFETAVAHLDAESCPDKSMNDKAFCRISVGGDRRACLLLRQHWQAMFAQSRVV